MNLLLGHAALYQIKVADALLGGSAAQLDAAAGRHVGQMRCRNLNIALDNVTEAEVCVNVGRSHLAGGYRADNGRRTGNGIAARDYMRGVRHKCVGFGLNLAAYDRSDLLERLCVDGLADGYDNDIARCAEQRLIGTVGTRTTVLAVGTDAALLHNIEKDGICLLDRYNTKFENLTNAVERLREGVQAYQENPAKIIRDGVIQRFEFTCELAWKTTHEFLLDQGFTELNSTKATMRKAFSYGLIDDEQAWITLLNARNQTSHLYDDATAQEIYSQIESEFMSLFDKLIEQLKRG